MDEVSPDPPELDPAVLSSISEHAKRVATWLEQEQAEAARHGHPSDSLQEQIAGWQFVADVMQEWGS